MESSCSITFAGFLGGIRRCIRIDMHLNFWGGREIECEDFLGDDAGAVEGMIEPKVGGEGRVRSGGDAAVFESVAGLEAEDGDGFDADIVVGGVVDDGGIGIVGDGAGQDVGRAAARMGDVDERDFDRFEGAVVVKIETGELAKPEFAVDWYPRMGFLAAIPLGFTRREGFGPVIVRGGFNGLSSVCVWSAL